MYPVEVQYQPLDAASEERGEISYVDAAVQAAERILYETNSGDVLIFMPGERDIRETGDQLEGRFSGEAEIIPLFGRLSAGDQQRVFAPSARRKIVIATNIAETSLTIPGIRYVIDAGLGAHQPLQPAHAHEASADRAGFAEQRQPAQRPRRPRRRRAFAFGFIPRRISTRARHSPSRKFSAPISPKSFCG